VRTTHSVLMLY